MSLPKEQAWFAAKRYGYGWGLPRRWQGWLVFGGYGASVAIAAARLIPAHRAGFAIYVVVATLMLVAICAWKGEAPRWRWGGSTNDE